MIDMKNRYPDTQVFDPDTLAPLNMSTQRRVDYLRTFFPEIVSGETFMDIGCSRGYLCHLFSPEYKKLYGFDSSSQDIAIAEKIAAENCVFQNTDFRGINTFQKLSKANKGYQADVVFVGNVHHYFYEAEVRNRVERKYSFVQKLAGAAGKYLIVDGPFEINDPAVVKLSVDNKWTDEDKKEYTFDKFHQAVTFNGAFKLIRKMVNQAGVRETVLYKRVQDDVPVLEKSSEEFQKFLDEHPNFINLKCNPNRDGGAVFHTMGTRVKMDKFSHSMPIYRLHNFRPDLFPKTLYMLTDNGDPAGDITEWVDESKAESFEEVVPFWLHLNNQLSTVGLFEPQLLYSDYAKRTSGGVVCLDTDMQTHYSDIPKKGFWKDLKSGLLDKYLGDIVGNYLRKNIFKENCFKELIDLLDKKGGDNE